jgi:hypothetical protein
MNIVKVPFHGDELLAARDERGVWVPIKRVCEALGIDNAAQQIKLKGKAWATVAIIPTVADDGKDRELFCIHVDSLPMWLATIETAKVKPTARKKLERYQCEAAKALADHFVRQSANDHRVERLRLFLLETKSERRPTWSQRVVKAICDLYGHPYDGGRHPRFLASVNDFIYRAINGDDVMNAVKERNPNPRDGSNHHQWLRQKELLESDLQIVHALAVTSRNPEEFRARLHWHFNKRPFQLGLSA